MYAGEEIECIITFRNIARVGPHTSDEELPTPIANGYSAAASWRTSAAQGRPSASRASSVTSGRGGQPTRGHRPSLSLNIVSAPSRGGLHGAPLQSKTPHSAVTAARGHGRSLSIMSLGSDVPSEGRTPMVVPVGKRATRGHGRSASLHGMPRPLPPQANVGLGIGSIRQPSPLYESTTPQNLPSPDGEPLPIRPGRKRPGTVSADTTPQLGWQQHHHGRPRPAGSESAFRFPAQPAGAKSPSPQRERPRHSRSPSTMHSGQQLPISTRPPEGWSGALNNLNPISRVMSESSMSGTPRSSSEFYSMSNHSDETLTSEAPYANNQNGRLIQTSARPRPASRSRHSTYGRPAEPETLMMGYAQTMGHFTLDGSLVNAAPFEEVKRKGVQGGGGVVGIERPKRSSGMFGAFSWGNIGESLGGLLGGDDMSSMAQMKADAGSKSVPLLSTPQSLLFVDLRLAPGESKSYSYRFALPRGLPPSHRGRAIRVAYHLALGIQRPGGQAVKTIEIPFRVLGSYNARGETLGHDLMSPYVLLQDAARTSSIVPSPTSPSGPPTFASKETQKRVKTPKQGLEDFLRYTERLLKQPQDSNGALVSPTSPLASPHLSRQHSLADLASSSIKEAIDVAILRSNRADTTGRRAQSESPSANRFNIARSGQPVAVLTILRPAYRLGEAVIGTIDLSSPGSCPTYAVTIELESDERVDSSLALRSSNSIHRVTRKVHVAAHENTLFARQISFKLVVPPAATPTFETTGVSLAWKLRVEFSTQRQGSPEGLLEELGTDERGAALIARERLLAETFEVAVPLKIYGAPGVEGVVRESEALQV